MFRDPDGFGPFWPNPDPAKPTLHLHIYKTFLKSLQKIILLHLLSNKISFHFKEELIQGIFFVPTAIKTLLKSRIRSKQAKSARHFLRPLHQCPSINCQTYQPYQLQTRGLRRFDSRKKKLFKKTRVTASLIKETII